MTLPEEASKVAVSAVETFKSQPILLMVLLLNALFLGVTYFASIKNRDNEAKAFGLIMNHCYPPPRDKVLDIEPPLRTLSHILVGDPIWRL